MHLVPISYSEDNLLRNGDNVMIYNVKTKGVLSVDLPDIIQSADDVLLLWSDIIHFVQGSGGS
eukprot:TRINITY_DN5693_c0_g1_i2.p2 TRINITY_DN5693_c0_g1~~TRINITY_DN5693_c0_g1_i2.p2  ORF type:complete len:63 (-),score=6.76 TRINITY_DN5693_c0_g1_i2:83-271(-)